MQELTYFNGEFVEPGAKVISIDDRGYLFGDSVRPLLRIVLPSRSLVSLYA